MILVRRGSTCEILEPRDRDAIFGVLRPRFSFTVEGAFFSPKFKSHVWDGKISLVRKIRNGPIVFPSGLWDEVVRTLEAVGYKFEIRDERPAAPTVRAAVWRGPEPRDYQRTAEEIVTAPGFGGGILKLPMRSGKTLTAAKIVATLGTRALFVVTSDLLLRQAREAFESFLGGVTVTTCGAGTWDDSGDIVIATVQTLAERSTSRAFVRLSKSFGIMFADELHHLQGSGDAWRTTIEAIDARIKVGLSATVWLDPHGENEEGAIYLRGICGPIVHEIGLSDLIDRGVLVRPLVRWIGYNAEQIPGGWSTGVYGEAIVECGPRNEKIVECAVDYAKRGLPCLVDVARIPHVRELADAIARSLPPGEVASLVGDTSATVRERVIADFRSGKVKVLVGTILGEGVDIPEIYAVINAEGGRGEVTTRQRWRNLTPAPGKTRAETVELVDLHHKTLREWTAERVRIYRSERAFKHRIEKA